jgi:phenylacetate-CoA ligase
MMIIRGVNVFPTQIEEQLFRCPGLSPHFVIEVTRPGRLDEMVVRVEARAELDPARYDEQGGLLAGYVKERVGISATIAVAPPGTVSRSAGKAVRVVDLRSR